MGDAEVEDVFFGKIVEVLKVDCNHEDAKPFLFKVQWYECNTRSNPHSMKMDFSGFMHVDARRLYRTSRDKGAGPSHSLTM